MNYRAKTCLFALGIGLVFSLAPRGVNAQSPVQYRIHWTYTNTLGVNEIGLVAAGSQIYDIFGEIGPAETFYSVRDFLSLPSEWANAACRYINNHGVGIAFVVIDAGGPRKGIWFDVYTRQWDFIDEPAGPVGPQGFTPVDINDAGDIVVFYSKGTEPIGHGSPYVYNPITGITSLGFEVWSGDISISNTGQVSGFYRAEGTVDWVLFRWEPGNLETLDHALFQGGQGMGCS